MTDSQPAVLMRQEIFEQPTVLANLIADAEVTLRSVAERACRCSLAVLAARGSSDNASTYGKYLLEGVTGLPTALAAPSLFTLYHTPPRLKDALVIGVSQSGEAADVVEVLQHARREGAVTLAVTNTTGSPLTSAAEYVVLLHAGLERALAATKTVTAQCAVYAVLAAMMSQNAELNQQLPELSSSIAGVIACEDDIAALAQTWIDVERSAVIGRGYCYGAAQETALKLKETCYMSAEPYSAADFMHGPLAMVEENYPMLMLLNADATQVTGLALLEKVRQRGAKVICLAATGVEYAQAAGVASLLIPSPSALLSPISFIVAGQLFALHLSVARGNNPDVSRGLKKVTVTR
jgi:glutamine---fructose-6-phosphate transaminase (isomerizing)